MKVFIFQRIFVIVIVIRQQKFQWILAVPLSLITPYNIKGNKTSVERRLFEINVWKKMKEFLLLAGCNFALA